MTSKSPHQVKYAALRAAQEGNLAALKVLLATRNSSDIKALTSARIDGTTLLIAACRKGHIDVVKYLVTKCHANVQQCCSVILDGETVENAPPLWCAAAAGHLNIVKELINYKANPNCTTKTNSTPLRAACFDGHLEIVKYLLTRKADVELANRYEHTCLMIACYKGHAEIVRILLQVGAAVNRSDSRGKTALHECAENGSLTIAKLLLKYKSKFKRDSNGTIPLMTAAIAGHVDFVMFFCSLPQISRKDKIEAIELLGATNIDKKKHDLLKAIHFWRKAIEQRSISPRLEKPRRKAVAVYGYVCEPNTLGELLAVRSNLEKCRMIALQIRERILGPRHPDTSYFLRYRGAVYADSGDFERCIPLWMYELNMQITNLKPLNPTTLNRFVAFCDVFSSMQQNRSYMSSAVPKVRFKQILDVLERAVNEITLGYDVMSKNKDMQLLRKSSSASQFSSSTNIVQWSFQASGSSYSSSSTSNNIVQWSYQVSGSSYSSSSVGKTSSSTRSIKSGVSGRSPSSNHNALSSCCSLCDESSQTLYKAMIITLHLTAWSQLVYKGPSTDHDIQKRKKLLYKLRSVRDHCGHNLLHLASCSKLSNSLGDYQVPKFPRVDVISLLLQCGFDVNARDCKGKTPANLTAESADKNNADSIVSVLNCLAASGARMA